MATLRPRNRERDTAAIVAAVTISVWVSSGLPPPYSEAEARPRKGLENLWGEEEEEEESLGPWQHLSERLWRWHGEDRGGRKGEGAEEEEEDKWREGRVAIEEKKDNIT